MTDKSYTREEIKSAIREELKRTNHLGTNNDNYYYIIGVVMEALNRADWKAPKNKIS